MENRVVIKLSNGKEIVAELYNYDGNHPEIVVFIDENGLVMQDICTVRPRLDYNYDVDPTSSDVECLVWGDENDEDYTHKFVIAQHESNE